jgi:hypothetical protein
MKAATPEEYWAVRIGGPRERLVPVSHPPLLRTHAQRTR